jgi:hypothetical protein
MRRLALVLAISLGAPPPSAAQDDIKVIHDPRPAAGIPPEARLAGTTPDPDSKAGPQSNVSFRIVTDLTDYGPLRNVVSGDIHAITVRYYDDSFKDIRDVQGYLTSVLRSPQGHTSAYCPWAEGLPVPSVEATVQFTSGRKGRWLLWRQGRSVYQDPDMKWWFTYGW